MTQLSITTDYCTSQGDPIPYLQRIAAAGFSHILWCHHFGDEYLYSPEEIRSLKPILKQVGLRLLDVHGSDGRQNSWYATDETARRAGVNLVRNRADLLLELEGEGTLIMHMPAIYKSDNAEEEARRRAAYVQFERSMDELLPSFEKQGIRVALENMPNETWELLETALKRYPAKLVGICYDSGHGNIKYNNLPLLERNKSRLIALHLNDNDALHDLHQPAAMGTADWDTLAKILATSSYSGPLSYEITMRETPFTVKDAEGKPIPLQLQPEDNQMAYLKDALARGLAFNDKVEAARG